MYIANGKGTSYASDGQWHHAAAPFMILMQPDLGGFAGSKEPIRAILRQVKLQPVGKFMMGTARVGGHSLTCLGDFGADGLTMSVQPAVYAHGVILPANLVEAWRNTGGGHNSAGSEASLLRKWARENDDVLTADMPTTLVEDETDLYDYVRRIRLDLLAHAAGAMLHKQGMGYPLRIRYYRPWYGEGGYFICNTHDAGMVKLNFK